MKAVRFIPGFFLRAGAARSLAVLGLALAAGLAAAWAARQHIQGHVEQLEAQARTPVVTRVVAAHDLPAGTRLNADHLAVRQFPAHLVPSDSIDAAHHGQLAGMVLRSALQAGDLVLAAHGRSVEHTAFSSHLGQGRRAVTMPVDAINSVSGLLEPGDLIDLYVSFDYQRRRITAPLLQGVLVLATGTQTVSPLEPSAPPAHGFSTVTLDTSPEDAVKLVAARQSGTITAVLRHPGDDLPTRRAVRGDLASLIGVANPPPVRSQARAPVLYGNQRARNVPRLVPNVPTVRNPSGLFDLPEAQSLVSAWLMQNAAAQGVAAEDLSHRDAESSLQRPDSMPADGQPGWPGDADPARLAVQLQSNAE
ncbi:MAG: Flp pilus assembly protein CpaB [Alcaligenaceae bacterium]|nr:Flp pilus assembly protein CpaB [Alcaligenaceae bacterium]